MKIFALHRITWQIFAWHILSCLIIYFVNETDAKLGHAGWAKSDSRTKQILQNLRTHIAQQAQEQQQKDCDLKLPTCVTLQRKQTEDDSSSETDDALDDSPTFRYRGRPKLPVPHKKDVRQPTGSRDRRSVPKKTEQEEVKSVPLIKKTRMNDKEDKVRVKIKEDVKEIKPPLKRLEEPDVEPKIRIHKSEPKNTSESTKPKVEAIHKYKKPDKDAIDKRSKPDEGKVQVKPLKKPTTAPKSDDAPETKRDPGKDKKKILKSTGKTDIPILKREKPSPKQKEDKPKGENVRFPEDMPVFSLTSDSVKSEQCKKHSRVYLRQLRRYKLWALMMYDATAKLPSGILQGNANQYGDFDQCLSVNATFKKREREGISGIEGKYCLATIDISSDSSDAGLQHAIHRSQSFAFVKSTVSDPGHFIPRFSTINWGLCIPSVCKAEDLENSIISSLGTYKKSSGLKFDVKVEEKNCVTRRDLLSDYDLKTLITLLFYAGVILVALYATIKDVIHKSNRSGVKKLRDGAESMQNDEAGKDEHTAQRETNDYQSDETSHGKAKAFVMAFSLKRNMKKLFIEGESEDSIHCIHGIKSIFTMMLYFAHKTIPLALTPFSNRVVFTEISNEASSMILRGSMIYTDSFLLISGVLTSFNLSKDIKKNGRILWMRRTVARLIRLTPALFATLLFYAHVSNHLGSGPMWNVIVNENSRLCQQHMWKNMLYIQNFYPFEEMCAPQTHQLALDMQLFLLSPLLVYFLHEYDKIGIGILQAFLMISSILRFVSTTNNELSIVIFHGMSISDLYKTANMLYSQPIHRATPYIVGVLVGFYLEKFGKQLKLPNLLVVFGWITSLCLAMGTMIAPAHLTKQHYEYDVAEAAHYAALSPIAWSVALGWLIAACHLGYGGKLNEYLSCKGFVIFSRISYSVYLTQFLVFSHIVGSKRIPEMFSVIRSLDATEFIIIILISIAMTLLFDIPTVEIKTIILSFFPSNKKKEMKREGEGETKEGEITDFEERIESFTPSLENERIQEEHRNESEAEAKYDRGSNDIMPKDELMVQYADDDEMGEQVRDDVEDMDDQEVEGEEPEELDYDQPEEDEEIDEELDDEEEAADIEDVEQSDDLHPSRLKSNGEEEDGEVEDFWADRGDRD